MSSSRPAEGRPRPKMYGYCRSGYISQKFEGSAPELNFAYTRSNISQNFGESALDLDFPYTRSNISQKSGGLHQIWTLHILEGIFHKNLRDLHQIWTLHKLEVKIWRICTRFGLYIYQERGLTPSGGPWPAGEPTQVQKRLSNS